jgi:GWxTD domain-containing protein
LAASLGPFFAAVGPAFPAQFPSASHGDIWFLADHAAFQEDGGSAVEEYYVRVPNNQFEFEELDETGRSQGRAFVSLTFLDAEGSEIGKAASKFEFVVENQAQALSSDRVQLFVLRESLDPRAVEAEVRVEDLNARKRGLIYLITKERKNGVARARIVPPSFPGRELGLSDVQFAWTVSPATGESRFAKGRLEVVPNPGRTYGLYQDTLQAYYEVYDQNPPDGGGVFIAEHRVLDDSGAIVAARADTITAAGRTWSHSPSIPVGDLSAGTFDLEVKVREFGGNRAASATRSFNVVWTEGSWSRSEQHILDEARVLLDEESYARFKEMQSGDRESYLAAFWASIDPTTNTARNELKERFLERVAFANANFTSAVERGLVSDRGRIYIRFGPPDELTREVLPRPGNSLSDVLDREEDIDTDLLSERTRRSRRDTEAEDPRQEGARFQNVDTRPYEIWSYTRQGEPLFPDREALTPVNGLKFIFVDDQGFGNYVLRYSNTYKRF